MSEVKREVKPLSENQLFTWDSSVTELLLMEIRDLLKEIKEQLKSNNGREN